jgi:hypothetical protein
MISFKDLTPQEQAEYGNGCGLSERCLNVPDFIFTASCRHHDFNFERGCGANHWYENLWKAPYYYTKANWDFYYHMLCDSYKWWHYVVATVYFVAVMLFSWPFFDIGRWKTKEEILAADRKSKERI